MNNKIKMQETKKMIDEIIEKGYAVKTMEFRGYNASMGGVVFSDKTESLRHFLQEIIIYKEDSLDVTYQYILNKYKAMLELEAIMDGSYFQKESVELVNYVKSKSE